jgi:hypothetical protein
MPDLVLSIIATGTADHPRFLVADPQNRFWTGKGWSEEEADGRLYVSVNDAGRAIQQILLVQHGDKPVRRFVAPVHLDLHSETELSLDQITDWLVKVARLSIDAKKNGNGPVEGTLGLTWIDWSQLREIKSARD